VRPSLHHLQRQVTRVCHHSTPHTSASMPLRHQHRLACLQPCILFFLFCCCCCCLLQAGGVADGCTQVAAAAAAAAAALPGGRLQDVVPIFICLP
jgi:hypothetical protein